VRRPRAERDRIALAQDVVLVADPHVEDTLEDDHDLLVGIVGVRLLTRAPARLDRREDHLEPAGHVAGQELVDRLEARVVDPAARLAADDAAGGWLVGEELGDREVQAAGDPLDGGDRGARHLALHLGEEALGDAGALGERAEGQAAGLAENPDPRAQLELRGHLRPPIGSARALQRAEAYLHAGSFQVAIRGPCCEIRTRSTLTVPIRHSYHSRHL
jgi:hypothetical protein